MQNCVEILELQVYSFKLSGKIYTGLVILNT